MVREGNSTIGNINEGAQSSHGSVLISIVNTYTAPSQESTSLVPSRTRSSTDQIDSPTRHVSYRTPGLKHGTGACVVTGGARAQLAPLGWRLCLPRLPPRACGA